MASSPNSPNAKKAFLLWDTGGLWALMAWESALAAGLALEPVTAAEIADGELARAGLLLVPGGWPSLKKEALGPEGAKAIRAFVEDGGFYLGFCGGAGLALSVSDGLGLVPLARAARSERLPSLNGPVYASPGHDAAGHAFWRGQQSPAMFHVWWPGQFAAPLPPSVTPVAVYQGSAPGMCSSDQAVDLVEAHAWPGLEKEYGLRLDPAGLAGAPAVLEHRMGEGRLLLSYLHLDTPQDPWGAKALRSIWREVLGEGAFRSPRPLFLPGPLAEPCCSLESAALALWRVGQELGLWRPRHPYMPLWRRGARGLEVWWLLRLTQALCRLGHPAPELEARVEPVLEHGPMVLAAHAARLKAESPLAGEAAWEAEWFPKPRRMGGELLSAMNLLELELLKAIRAAGD